MNALAKYQQLYSFHKEILLTVKSLTGAPRNPSASSMLGVWSDVKLYGPNLCESEGLYLIF